MTTLSQARGAEKARQTRILWLAEPANKGVLTRIARELGVTQPFVSDVFHGRRTSRDRRVEQRLAELGAPGFAVASAA